MDYGGYWDEDDGAESRALARSSLLSEKYSFFGEGVNCEKAARWRRMRCLFQAPCHPFG